MKFLVVDSSRSVAAFLKLIVEGLAFEWVQTAQEGLALLKEGDGVDIVFFDWGIPDRDLLVKFDSPRVKKIALCSGLKKRNLEEIVAAEVDGLISKPFTKQRFNDCLINNRRTQASPKEIQDSPHEAVEGHRLRVLYCEDDQGLRDLIQAEFDELGNYDVSFANDGKEGFELISNQKFDAVITDINMPGMNGLELIDGIRKSQQNSQTPVFIFSGQVDPGVEEFARQKVIDIFYKPFDIHDILKDIHSKVFPAGIIPSYHSTVVDYWYESINEVFSVNVGDCGFGTVEMLSEDFYQGYISSSIGMLGPKIKGRIHIVADHYFCVDYIEHLFGNKDQGRMNELSSYFGELANQLAGRLKLKLEAHEIDMQITLPETHFGKQDFTEEREGRDILLTRVQTKQGGASLFLVLSKIGDEVFRNKSKNVVLTGGLFF